MAKIAKMFKYIQFQPKKLKYQNNSNKPHRMTNGLIKSWNDLYIGIEESSMVVQEIIYS